MCKKNSGIFYISVNKQRVYGETVCTLYNVKYYVLHYQKPQRVIITLLRCVK